VGEGDIVDANSSGYGCTLEQFKAQDTACSQNEVSGDYFVNYKAEPRPGWRFVRWIGPCSPNSDFQHCLLEVSEDWVVLWDETYPDVEISPSTAVFAPITGNTGFLVGPAVAGVAWQTPTQQGVTGLDGSFQYEEGETVRFMIGGTLLGEVTGQAKVTPFELAGSPVHTGIRIAWALQKNDKHDFFDNFEIGEHVGPFDAVVNIAVFLQTLDHDADPENGIQIRPAVARLFRGVSLDLSQKWEDFLSQEWEEGRNEPVQLRHALWKANTKGGFSVPHGIVKPAAALEHLYATLKIDARTLGLSLVQDEGGDGSLGDIERWQYDANGNVVRYEHDRLGFESWHYDANGNVTWYERDALTANSFDKIEAWQYDANGNVTRHEDDSGADSTPEKIETWQYHANGNVTRYEVDGDADGTLEKIETWQYHANGKVARHELDGYADGTLQKNEAWQYYPNGKVARHEFYFELTPDFTFHGVETWKYAHGNVTLFTYEGNDLEDGPGSSVTRYRYDANGNVTRETTDWGADGTPGNVETWQYNANGKVTLHEDDSDADGTPDEIETWKYHDNGKVRRYEVDGDADGTPEEIEIWKYNAKDDVIRRVRVEAGSPVEEIETWQYHANGAVMQHEYKRTSSPSDTHDERRQYQYDANGNLTRYEADGINYNEDEDDMADIIQSWRYDATGNLTLAVEDSDADGRLDYIETWQYDLDGNLTRSDVDENGDGAIEDAATYQYEATGWGHLFSGVEVFGHGSSPPLKPRPNPGQCQHEDC